MPFLTRPVIRCFSLALFFGLLIAPIPIPLRVLVIACTALVWTFLEAGSLKPLGLGRHRLAPTLIWGIGIAVGTIAFGAIFQPLIERMLGTSVDYSAYGALKGNAALALQLLALALTSAAIGEEILFRGFLLHQLTALLGAGKSRRWIAIVSSGTVFGVGHMVQGPLGIVMSGIAGLVFAWAWYRTERNLWALILAHALIDTHGIGMLYLGWVP